MVRTVLRLAWADLWAERVLALCSVLAVAAVLAPLVVLAGLRAGVVEGLREMLLEDPHAREIATALNGTLEADWLEQLAGRADVSFLMPRTRTLAARMVLAAPAGTPSSRVDLVPTRAGDPLIPQVPGATDEIVLSAAAAARLGATVGTPLVGRFERVADGQRQTRVLALKVVGIAPPVSSPHEAAFVTLDLALGVEDFQNGEADLPEDLATLKPPPRHDYAGFRLYATRLEEVPGLDAALRHAGVQVVSRAGDVANLLAIDRNLSILFALVALLGGAGFLVSLGSGLWANVERKRTALALLRFFGMRRRTVSLFPLAQAAVLALLGAALAVAAAFAAGQLVNHALAGTLRIQRPLCVISPQLALAAVGVTLAGALLAAGLASLRVATIQPWEGVSAP